MLQTQQKFLNYLHEAQVELGKVNSVGDLQKNIQAIEPLKQDIAEAELIVPVVGAFSAGKSALINSFLGADLLSVGITPETALATELRHADSEYVEAVAENGAVDRFSIEEIRAINEKASQYQYAKVFLNSEPLRGIVPLVLVDMPGFDSPLDLHHRAILTYLSRGSHYAVLISVEEGTVTRSAARQLSEIHEAEKAFSLFLSKTNLRSPSEVEDIARNIAEQLENDFDFDDDVVSVGLDGGESLAKMLQAIDPEALFYKVCRPSLEAHFFELDGSLNTWISGLQKDEQENQAAIDEIGAGLRDLERNKEEIIQDIHARYSTHRVDTIVEGVGVDLSNSVEELIGIAMSSGKDAFQRELEETVRTSLVTHTEAEMKQLNQQIAEDLTSGLEGISSTLSSYTNAATGQYQYLEKIPQLVDVGSKIFQGVSTSAKTLKGGLTLYRGVTAAIAITTSIVMPLLELVIVFLPEIIDWLRRWMQKGQIHDRLVGMVIPLVKRKIRSELPKHFDEQVNLLINEQAKVLDAHIKAKQDEIAKAEKAKKDAGRNIEQEIAELTTIRDNIRSLANQVIFAQ